MVALKIQGGLAELLSAVLVIEALGGLQHSFHIAPLQGESESSLVVLDEAKWRMQGEQDGVLLLIVAHAVHWVAPI